MDTHFEPQAPSLDTLILTAIEKLPLAWSVAAHRMLIGLPQDLRVFLLRCLPTAAEYEMRIHEATRMAKRQLRRWGYADNPGVVAYYVGTKIDAAILTIAADICSALEILRCKIAYRAHPTQASLEMFSEFSDFVRRYPL